jgi:hypothetical protein
MRGLRTRPCHSRRARRVACAPRAGNGVPHVDGPIRRERAQVAALVAMVQEAVAMIAGNQTSLQETLTGSADRFARLATVNNVREIQAQLVKEVTTLKRGGGDR